MTKRAQESSWTDCIVPIAGPTAFLWAVGCIGYGLAIGQKIKFEEANPVSSVISHAAFKSYCNVLKNAPKNAPDEIQTLCKANDENSQNITRAAFKKACLKMPEQADSEGLKLMKDLCNRNEEYLQTKNIDTTAIINSMPRPSMIN